MFTMTWIGLLLCNKGVWRGWWLTESELAMGMSIWKLKVGTSWLGDRITG